MKTHQQEEAIGVLIVDDHDGYRAVAAEVVNVTKGFVVAGRAACRDQALDVFHDHRADIDLILMDVNLGDDDGVNLTSELLRHDPDVQVVLVTALSIEDLPQAARHCGARGYLAKAKLSPSTLAQLDQGVYDWPDDNPARGVGR